MSATTAKRMRRDIRFFLKTGLNDRGIAIQTNASERLVRREKARLKNIEVRNEEKRRHEVQE